MVSSNKLHVVIAKYKEDTAWTSNLTHPFTIYNKNEAENHLFEHNLPNVGTEGHTFLHHITNHYNNLPDFLVLVQGSPFDHCIEAGIDFLKTINNFDFSKTFLPLGRCYFRDPTSTTPELDQMTGTYNFAKQYGIEHSVPIKFISSAQCLVSKDLILQKPQSFYQKLLDIFQINRQGSIIGYYLEYLMPTILGFADQLITINKYGDEK